MNNIGLRVPGSPAIRRMDPRSKIIAAMALSLVALSGGASVLGVTTCAIVAISLAGRLPLRHIYHASRPALPFIVLLFLLHLFSTQGEPLVPVRLGAVRLSLLGLTQGTLLAWRFALLVVAGSLLTLTTPASELAAGMERLLRPAAVVGISSQDLALMLSLALRFMPTISMEMASLKEAIAARGVSFDAGGPVRRLRASCDLAVPLCLAVFRRCDELVVAMEARGYDGGARSVLRELILRRADRLVIAASVVAVAMAALC